MQEHKQQLQERLDAVNIYYLQLSSCTMVKKHKPRIKPRTDEGKKEAIRKASARASNAAALSKCIEKCIEVRETQKPRVSKETSWSL
jgi:hypothetical protein